MEEDNHKYQIERFYKDPDRPSEILKKDLTYWEAKSHCKEPYSKGDDWFDGFRRQED